MLWMRWVAVGLAVLEGGWLAYDGSRALLRGDYVTPRSGEHAGRLGGWADVVSAVGIEPRSTFMKGVHVVLGAAWLLAATALVAGAEWAPWGITACAVASMWYLPFGPVLGLAQILILWLFLPAAGP